MVWCVRSNRWHCKKNLSQDDDKFTTKFMSIFWYSTFSSPPRQFVVRRGVPYCRVSTRTIQKPSTTPRAVAVMERIGAKKWNRKRLPLCWRDLATVRSTLGNIWTNIILTGCHLVGRSGTDCMEIPDITITPWTKMGRLDFTKTNI